MSSISGINATSNRIGGLVSGLNTDEIVEGMLANTQNKINKQYQNRQSIFWKQEAYRNIIRSVNTFTSPKKTSLARATTKAMRKKAIHM